MPIYIDLQYNIFVQKIMYGGIYMGRNYSNKNLTILELGNIEFYLNEGKGFTEIGRILEREHGGQNKKFCPFFV